MGRFWKGAAKDEVTAASAKGQVQTTNPHVESVKLLVPNDTVFYHANGRLARDTHSSS